MVTTLLLNVSDNREVLDDLAEEKRQDREVKEYFKDGVVRSGKASWYLSKELLKWLKAIG